MSARATRKDQSRTLRALAFAGAALAFGLLVWRGADVLSAPAPSEPVSQQDQALLNLIEPIAGAGNVRIAVRYTGEAGARAFVILINGAETAASPYAPRIEQLLVASAGYTPARDTLTIQQFPFAAGASAAPEPAQLAELTALGVLMLLLCMIGMSARTPAPQFASAEPREDTSQPDDHRAAERPAAPQISPRAAAAAAQDPAKTAEVIRKWLAGETAA